VSTETVTSGQVPERRSARSVLKWVLLIALVTFFAGLLFGYDQGVIAGALAGIGQDFKVGNFAEEVITSWVTLGALFSALVAGTLADRFGRKPILLSAGVLFIGGAVIQGVAPDVPVLTAGRVITGFGIGFASTIAPLYAAEMAPTRIRGRMVSTYQLAITVGIFFAYLVSDLLEPGRWREMFLVAIIPGTLLILGVLVVPESSRWLAKMGKEKKAKESLAKVTPADQVDAHLSDMEHELAHEKAEGEATWGDVFSPGIRKALVVGVGLSIFQQVTGINAIIYYANTIFESAGLTSTSAQTTATLYCVGLTNVLATFIAVAYVDRFGRKPLLFLGLTGMFVALCAVGLGFAIESTADTGAGASIVGIITMAALVIFIASFAFSLGPIVWTIISEIYPNRVRGRAVSLATAANWGAAFLVTQFFLTVVDGIGESATFFILAGMCVLAYAFIWRYVPETKGRSLEQIQAQWAKGGSTKDWEEGAA
jgi:SP family galactose:H+ symporter-like MFS transporter